MVIRPWLQQRLRGGDEDAVDALLHGVIPANLLEDPDMAEEGDGLIGYGSDAEGHADELDDEAVEGGGAHGEHDDPEVRPALPRRPTARFYQQVSRKPIHPLTSTTVYQACYCALKIKVDYNIHDLAFDCMVKFAAAILPPGHYLPGFVLAKLKCMLYGTSNGAGWG